MIETSRWMMGDAIAFVTKRVALLMEVTPGLDVTALWLVANQAANVNEMLAKMQQVVGDSSLPQFALVMDGSGGTVAVARGLGRVRPCTELGQDGPAPELELQGGPGMSQRTWTEGCCFQLSVADSGPEIPGMFALPLDAGVVPARELQVIFGQTTADQVVSPMAVAGGAAAAQTEQENASALVEPTNVPVVVPPPASENGSDAVLELIAGAGDLEFVDSDLVDIEANNSDVGDMQVVAAGQSAAEAQPAQVVEPSMDQSEVQSIEFAEADVSSQDSGFDQPQGDSNEQLPGVGQTFSSGDEEVSSVVSAAAVAGNATVALAGESAPLDADSDLVSEAISKESGPPAPPAAGSAANLIATGQPVGQAPAYYGVLGLSNGPDVQLQGDTLFGRMPSMPQDLGRGKPIAVVVNSPLNLVSRSHCMVRIDNGVAFIVDMNSNNGTYLVRPDLGRVQLTPGEPVALAVGDLVDLGDNVIITVKELT